MRKDKIISLQKTKRSQVVGFYLCDVLGDKYWLRMAGRSQVVWGGTAGESQRDQRKLLGRCIHYLYGEADFWTYSYAKAYILACLKICAVYLMSFIYQ